MMARIRVGFALALILGLVGAQEAPSTAAATAASPTTSTDIATAETFRAKFGLNSTERFVRGVATDPTASLEFGVPLLPAEVADLTRRAQVASSIGPVTEALEKDPAFAGLYTDQSVVACWWSA